MHGSFALSRGHQDMHLKAVCTFRGCSSEASLQVNRRPTPTHNDEVNS